MVEVADGEWSHIPTPECYQPAAAVRDKKQILEWAKKPGHWSGSGKHVYYKEIKGRIHSTKDYLGRGGAGVVERVTFQSVTMAQKKIYVRRKPIEEVREEANIMEKLTHRHIVDLVGTYTKGRELHLLIYPVAVCNLQDYLDDIDEVRSGMYGEIVDAWERLGALGFKPAAPQGRSDEQEPELLERPLNFLASTLGCVTEALSFVHKSGVRHQDLKPRNILLGPGQVFLADFGISRDLKEAPHSLTEGFHGGTPLFLAPEVARGDAHHMSPADIYSLGCVFLTAVSVLYAAPHRQYEVAMGERDPGKKAAALQEYFDDLRVRAAAFGHATHDEPTCSQRNPIALIEQMFSQEPKTRPTACQVSRTLYELGGIHQTYHNKCCKKDLAHVTQLIDSRIKASDEGRSEQARQVQHLQKEHEANKLQIEQLQQVQHTYKCLAERERKHAVEQYEKLLDRRTKELEIANAAKKSLEIEIAQLRRQRQPQRNERRGGPPPPKRNGIESLAKLNTSLPRRASNLPLPIRPSTPLRPSLAGSSNCSSGDNTLHRSVNSVFSKTTVASNESFDSEKSIGSISPETASLKTSLPPSPMLRHGEDSTIVPVEKTAKTWADMLRGPVVVKPRSGKPAQSVVKKDNNIVRS